MGKRSKARECAFQMLYQWDLTREPMERVANLFWKVRSGTDDVKAMAERLARGAQKEQKALDEAIGATSKNWRLDRIASVDLNIMRIAGWELGHDAKTPTSVIIDEAVELAKRFGAADSSVFVNGVLDAMARKARGKGASATAAPLVPPPVEAPPPAEEKEKKTAARPVAGRHGWASGRAAKKSARRSARGGSRHD